MKIVVSRSRCIAMCNCIGMAPNVFMLDGSRKAIVRDAKGANDATVIAAAKACPTKAIRLYDEETGKPIYP
jgi:molecular chaperone DnaJ